MLQLVYISTARDKPDAAMLDAILASSRRNNARVQVTGLLVAGGKRFLQALEGPDQAVLDTYARIQNDPRHRAVVLLSCRPTAERSFGAWDMAFEQGGEAGEGGTLQAAIARLTANLEDKSLRAQFTGFGEVHQKAA